MIEIRHTVTDPMGLHAKPASALVQEATRWQSAITAVRGGVSVSATDMMGLMRLDAREGDLLVVRIEGADEAEAHAALQPLVEKL